MNRTLPGVLRIQFPDAPTSPVVFDSPHSGTEYPEDFGFAAPKHIVRLGEDTFVHELFATAPAHGAVLLEALFPRTYIDPNRTVTDMDPELLAEPWPGELAPGVKTEAGIGLIWRIAQPGVPMYDRKLTVAEVEARIEDYHHPYQQALIEAVNRMQERFGAVWHVNCHSMPAVSDERSPEGPGRQRPDFCIGDRDGTTCNGEFTELVVETLRGLGYETTVNDPYKGVELIRMIGDPAKKRQSLQIEINRGLHIEEATKEKTSGFAGLQADLDKLAAAICDYARGEVNG